MKGKNVFKLEFFVGLFFMGAIVLFIYLTVIVNGKELLFQRGRNFLTVNFPSVETLNRNDKVYCMGVHVGRVKGFDFSTDGKGIIVNLALDRELEIREGYSVEIRNTSLLGGKYVHIFPGEPGAKAIPEGTILEGKPPVDIIQDASNLIEKLREDEEKFRKEFLSGDFPENLKSAADNINKLFIALNEGQGTFSKILNDPSLYDEAKAAFAQINASGEDLKKLLADLDEGKGSIGKLVKDETLYDELKSAVENINKFASNLSEGRGSLGKITSDDGKLYDMLSEAVASLNKVSSSLAEGKGTIGKLLNDDAIYYETKAAINQLRGAVEDFREQAPIATLGSMLLGAL